MRLKPVDQGAIRPSPRWRQGVGEGWGEGGDYKAHLEHGGCKEPRGHPESNVQRAAQGRLAVQVRSQGWEQPCRSPQHKGKATRTRL